MASRPLTSVHLPFPSWINNLLSCTFVICFQNPVNNCVEYVKIFIFPNNSVFQWIITKFKTILKIYWLNSNYLHKIFFKKHSFHQKKQNLLITQRPSLTKQYKYQQTMVYIYEECIVQQREVQHKMEEPLTRSFCCVYTTMKSV